MSGFAVETALFLCVSVLLALSVFFPASKFLRNLPAPRKGITILDLVGHLLLLPFCGFRKGERGRRES